jgi:hypothetical protein
VCACACAQERARLGGLAAKLADKMADPNYATRVRMEVQQENSAKADSLKQQLDAMDRALAALGV